MFVYVYMLREQRDVNADTVFHTFHEFLKKAFLVLH